MFPVVLRCTEETELNLRFSCVNDSDPPVQVLVSSDPLVDLGHYIRVTLGVTDTDPLLFVAYES